ncbi:MAG: hypothetical protein EXR47_07700 [Dehalococcoidia bacterium]|nr:hypothetical protein [Dehalococcoidia bacterium]
MPATTPVIHHESHSHEADLGLVGAYPRPTSALLSQLSRGVAWFSVVLGRIVPVELSEDQHHLRR